MNDQEIILSLGINLLNKLEATIQKSYSYIDLLMQSTPMLCITSSGNVRQALTNTAIDYNLERMCKESLIDLNFRYEKNAKGNHTHIELFKDNFILTHSSVPDEECFPRRAIFREELASTNQFSLYDNIVDPNISYGILTHCRHERKETKAVVFLGIPDQQYGNWCNHISLSQLISVPESVINESEFKEFEFQIKKRINEKSV